MVYFAILAAIAAAVAPPSSGRHGNSSPCLGQQLERCVSYLKAAMSVDENLLQMETSRLNDVDVMGKRVGGNRITVDGKLNGFDSHVMVGLELSPTKSVSSIEINFPGNGSATIARTAAEYDETGLFNALRLIAGDTCVQDKLAVYRLFEASIKPRLKLDPTSRTVDMAHAEESHFQHSSPIQFCGWRLTYEQLSGHDTNYIDETNSTGVYVMQTIRLQ